MRAKYYLLNKDGNPVEEKNILKWSTEFEKTEKEIAHKHIWPYCISTDFLGIALGNENKLFRTVAFGPYTISRKYVTREDALKGHKEIVSTIRWRWPFLCLLAFIQIFLGIMGEFVFRALRFMTG